MYDGWAHGGVTLGASPRRPHPWGGADPMPPGPYFFAIPPAFARHRWRGPIASPARFRTRVCNYPIRSREAPKAVLPPREPPLNDRARLALVITIQSYIMN